MQKQTPPEKPVSMLTTDSLRRLLILNNFFINHTSETDIKSVQDIIDYLKRFERSKIKSSRATLYRDLKQLKKLTGCENFHKKNKLPSEISAGEYEICDESGYYYTEYAKRYAFDFNFTLPFPITQEQVDALKRLKDTAERSNDKERAADLKIVSELVSMLLPQDK